MGGVQSSSALVGCREQISRLESQATELSVAINRIVQRVRICSLSTRKAFISLQDRLSRIVFLNLSQQYAQLV